MQDPKSINVNDLCRFGIETTNDAGDLGPARKRTGFLTSSWAVAEELAGTCDGTHSGHYPLLERRAKNAAIYPPQLCRAIARGAARQKLADEACVKTSRPLTRGSLLALLIKDVKEDWKDEVHEEDGGDDRTGFSEQEGIEIMDEQMKELKQDMNEGKAWDDVSGMELEVKRVRDARMEDYFLQETQGLH